MLEPSSSTIESTSADASAEYDERWRFFWANTHAGGPMARTRYRLALQWLNLNPNSRLRVLDVGAGNGAFIDLLQRRYPALQAFGAELSEAAIALAPPTLRARIAKCNLQTETPLPWGGSFDVITCMEVLEHLPDDYIALRQIVRALSPGGRLLVSVPAWTDQWGPQDVAAGHVRRYQPDSMRQLLEETGLRLLRINCWGGPFARVYLRAADTIGPQRVMSVRLNGIPRLVAAFVYQLLKIDDVIPLARGPQLLVVAEKP